MKYVLVAIIAFILSFSVYTSDRYALAGPCNPQQTQC
jgi:hypothetical protein